MLLLTNPGNPVGTVHSAARLRALAAWCGGAGVHMVVDEIYANCVCVVARPCDERTVCETVCPRPCAHSYAGEGAGGDGGGAEAAGGAASRSDAGGDAACCGGDAAPRRVAAADGAAADAASARGDDAAFTSIVDALGGDAGLGGHVHVLWGLSKDWGASGCVRTPPCAPA